MAGKDILNDGAIKIFKFLKLLYEDNADYNKVTEIFQRETKEISKDNIQVVLNRYINTLKVFGIKIEKESTKYKLKSNIYTVDYTSDDLKAISIITGYMQNFPDNKLSQNMKDFLYQIGLRMKTSDKIKLNSLINSNNYDFSFYYSDIKNQVLECEKICSEKYQISIVYMKNNKQYQTKGVMKEIVYGRQKVNALVYDMIKHTTLEIPIKNILSITRFPQIASNMEMATTVVYKLKNRLAKTYKLKENETSQGYNEKGELIVINKNESFDSLLHRLMRYADSCEIISPKNLREEMIKMIEDTINNYKNEK